MQTKHAHTLSTPLTHRWGFWAIQMTLLFSAMLCSMPGLTPTPTATQPAPTKIKITATRQKIKVTATRPASPTPSATLEPSATPPPPTETPTVELPAEAIQPAEAASPQPDGPQVLIIIRNKSCYLNYFYVDGVMKAPILRNDEQRFTVTAGPHVVRWCGQLDALCYPERQVNWLTETYYNIPPDPSCIVPTATKKNKATPKP